MHSLPRSAPRLVLLPPLLAALTACSSGSNVDGDLQGRIGGRDVQLHVKLDSDGAGVNIGTLPDDPNRDIAPGSVLLGGVPNATSISGSKCLIDPCPPLAELTYSSPPPLVYAGTWKAPDARLVFTDENFYPQAGADFSGPDSHFELTFKEPDFSSSGDVTMVNTGTLDAAQVSKNGETLTFKGDFRLEYQCHKQSVYYRHCGNQKGFGPNPIHRPYTENTCPAQLVTPYEGEPSWSGNTLTLGGFKIDCREGDSTSGDSKPLLCYQRRTKVSAGGCTWTVHFLTDGSIQQFAIAGFADGACAQKTCNTYR